MKHEDLYAETTARIVTALEAGAPPWVRPWSSGVDTLPMNAQTGRVYRGINVVLLAMESQRQGYALDRWLSYRQAAELGGQVRRGEQGSTVVFWRLRKLDVTADSHPHARDDDISERIIPLLRAYTVFNVAQVDGLPSKVHAAAKIAWEPEARAEELLLMSGVVIHHGGPVACYRPAADDIQLPPRGRFPTAASFYGTALHELTHATSHPKRCDRQLGKRFGDDAYAAEELIAEMGAAFLCAYCRIDGELQHPAYLDHWLKVLRADKRAIFVSATKAQQAADWVLRMAQPTDQEPMAA